MNGRGDELQDFSWLTSSQIASLSWSMCGTSGRGIQGICTASICRNYFGVELRVEHDGKLIESRLSRVGEEPLLLIADQLKANLIERRMV
jgi:hypothetical protein